MTIRVRRIIIFNILCLGFWLLPPSIIAQDTVRIVSEDQSGGITLELDANALDPASGAIAISDSSGQEFALSSLKLDDQGIWIKKSREESNRENGAHWYYDEDSKILFINLNGIKESFPSASVLQLTVLPVTSYTNSFYLSVLEGPANAVSSLEELQKISDLKIDLK